MDVIVSYFGSHSGKSEFSEYFCLSVATVQTQLKVTQNIVLLLFWLHYSQLSRGASFFITTKMMISIWALYLHASNYVWGFEPLQTKL